MECAELGVVDCHSHAGPSQPFCFNAEGLDQFLEKVGSALGRVEDEMPEDLGSVELLS